MTQRPAATADGGSRRACRLPGAGGRAVRKDRVLPLATGEARNGQPPAVGVTLITTGRQGHSAQREPLSTRRPLSRGGGAGRPLPVSPRSSHPEGATWLPPSAPGGAAAVRRGPPCKPGGSARSWRPRGSAGPRPPLRPARPASPRVLHRPPASLTCRRTRPSPPGGAAPALGPPTGTARPCSQRGRRPRTRTGPERPAALAPAALPGGLRGRGCLWARGEPALPAPGAPRGSLPASPARRSSSGACSARRVGAGPKGAGSGLAPRVRGRRRGRGALVALTCGAPSEQVQTREPSREARAWPGSPRRRHFEPRAEAPGAGGGTRLLRVRRARVAGTGRRCWRPRDAFPPKPGPHLLSLFPAVSPPVPPPFHLTY